METGIRPLSLGEILDRTAQLYRSYFLLFTGIFAGYAGLLLVLNLLQIGIMPWSGYSHAPIPLKIALFAALAVKVFVVVAAAGITSAAISRAVASVHLGQPTTIRAAYARTLPRAGRYLWLTAIIYFVIGGPFLLLAAGLGAVLATTPGLLQGHLDTSNQGSMVTLGVAFAVFGLLAIGWLVYAILMSLRYALSVPSCVLEDLKARASIRRSIELTKGARGRIFVLLLLVIAIEIAIGLAGQTFTFIAAFKHHGRLGPLEQSFAELAAFFTNTFIGPIYATGLTLFYYDQRIRKEGFDIEWMMSAAGLSAAAAPAPETSTHPPGPAPSLPAAETPHE